MLEGKLNEDKLQDKMRTVPYFGPPFLCLVITTFVTTWAFLPVLIQRSDNILIGIFKFHFQIVLSVFH